MRGDLHLHSTASDGLLEPQSLVAALRAGGVGVAALTDHDTCDGFPAFAAAAAKAGVLPICGAEIAAEQGGREVHLLSYFRRPPEGPYREILIRLAGARHGRAREMLSRLRAQGIALDEAEVLAHARPGRPHVARAMVAAGAVRDMRAAFEQFLSPGRPAYVQRMRPDARAVIVAARMAGGLTTLAHPCRYEQDPLAELAEVGIDAVEVVHPSADLLQREALRQAAAGLGLCVTGGSDFHGKSDDPPLGTYVLEADELDRLLACLGA